MAIKRQSIKAGISQGNFGVAGTPLPNVAQRSGPDLGRLASALGLGVKSAIAEVQKEDTAAGKAAIQQALIDTKNSSPEERAKVLGDVRAKFEDQGLFIQMFTDENPAVKAMDKVTGMAKALETKQALLAAAEQNKHLSLEEQQDIQYKILQESAEFSKSISEDTGREFLNLITNDALALDERIGAAHAERLKQENILQVTDTYFQEGVDAIAGAIQMQPETMNSDLESFDSGRAAMLNDLVGIKVRMATKAQEEFNTLLTLTDKISAGSKVTDGVISLAEKFNSPELLDILQDKSVKGTNKEALGKFNAKVIEEARERITVNNAKKRANLIAYREKAEAVRFDNFYNSALDDIKIAVQEAQLDPTNIEKDKAARDRIAEHQRAFDIAKSSGAWTFGIAESRKMQQMLNAEQLTYEKSEGDDTAEREATSLINSRSASVDDYNRLAPHLSPETKARFKSYITPMLQAENIRTENTVKAELAHEQAVLERPIEQFKETPFLDATLENAKNTLVERKAIQELNPKEFTRDMEEALLELDSQTWKKEGRLPTLQERSEVRDKVLDKWNKIREDYRTKIRDYHEGDENVKKQSELNTLVSDLTTSNIFSGKQLNEKQLKSFKTLLSDPKASEGMSVAMKKVASVNAAKMAILNENPDTVAKAIDIAKDWLGKETFNPKNVEHRKLLGSVVASGLRRGAHADIFSDTAEYKFKRTGRTDLLGITQDIIGTGTEPMFQLFERVTKTGTEAAGLSKTIQDEIGEAITTGRIFTPKGLEKLKSKYPDSKLFEGLESILDTEKK